MELKTSQKVYLFFKRIIDILGSLLGIIMCFIFLWWWVLIVNTIVTKGHPFFLQERVGKNGKPFKLLKFRSMKIDADPNLTSEHADIEQMSTPFGNFLRKTSIDETPQLLNIFVGQMSFIGPRPLLDKDEDHITIELRKQYGSIKIRPGMSGYAQINGRTSIGAETKAKFDNLYFERFNFIIDVKIFVCTLIGKSFTIK